MDGTADGVVPSATKLVDYQRPRDRNIDLTPLLDVVFQLLIFFMVSSQFVAPKAKLDLPMGKGGAQPDDSTSIRVEVTSGGELRVEDEVITDDDYETAIKAAMEKRGVEKVQFHGDRTMDFGNFVGLMERAQEVGVKGFEIVKNPIPIEAEDP
jgi:biopolymer transport protein ExbD